VQRLCRRSGFEPLMYELLTVELDSVPSGLPALPSVRLVYTQGVAGRLS
jgi:hypothetical protein